MIREIQQDEIVAEVSSPGFLVPPPDIIHGERIPPEPLAAMSASWHHPLFAPRGIRIAALNGVFVAAEGLVITPDGDVIASTIQQHETMDVEAAVALVRIGQTNASIPHVRGQVLLCRKPGAWNYGHWLVEMLPKIWLCLQYISEPFDIMVQDVGEPLRSIMAESLMLLGVDGRRCIAAGPGPVFVDRLLIVDGMTHHGTYISPLVASCLQEISAPIPPRGPDKLLIHRSSVPSRRFADEQRVLDRAAHAGFSVLDPANLPLRAQIAAFKAARCIVGATGAALTNLAFAQPGSRAFTLTPATMADTFFWFIAGHGALHLVDMRCVQEGPARGPAEWDTDIVVEEADMDAVAVASVQPPPPKLRTARQSYERLMTLFDASYYLAYNADVAAAGIDPLQHFMAFGWREGRNPSRAFNIAAYYRSYADVAQADINPLLHYVLRGESEGRRAFDVGA